MRIAEFKSKLSEFLRMVQGGSRLAVLDRNSPLSHVVPIKDQRGPRTRKPAPGKPAPGKVRLPGTPTLPLDVVELLLAERQS